MLGTAVDVTLFQHLQVWQTVVQCNLATNVTCGLQSRWLCDGKPGSCRAAADGGCDYNLGLWLSETF